MQPRRVLIVEDEGFTSGLLCAALKGAGFDVYSASSAAEARRAVADFDPDNRDIANGLAALKDDGYQWCTREQIDIDDAHDDPAAEFFDPPTYEE